MACLLQQVVAVALNYLSRELEQFHQQAVLMQHAGHTDITHEPR
ncbi:hypothetical protein HaLaN_25521 [Haematococcus lacustris]|uniref:Uncharacterized protein n=1 Tax=Haematococcus lacustris TaxID=44745 RepID=A0A699ZXQ0_HAELA|nr:hypothetical protein HaLaN_25521 [Haematococcus lacustris]